MPAIPWTQMGSERVAANDLLAMRKPQAPIRGQYAMVGPYATPEEAVPGFYAPEPDITAPITQTDINVAANMPPPAAGDDPMARFQGYLDQLDTKGQEALAQQRIGLSQSQQSLDAARGIPVQTNLQPLMALADTWWGGSLSKGYTPPESTMDRVKTIETLQAGLQKQRGALSDAEVALLKQRLSGESDLAGMQNQKDLMRLKRQELNAAAKDRADLKGMQRDADEATRFEKSDMAKDMKISVRGRELINQARNVIKKYGGIPLTGPARSEFEAIFTNLQLEQKEQANLGAIAGPDLGFIVKSIGDPGLFASAVERFASTKGGVQGLLAKIDIADRNVQDKYNRAYQLANTRFKSGIAKDMIGDFDSQWKATAGASTGGASQESQEAVIWLNENPNHPAAAGVRERLKREGVVQ